nr:TonB-dependent receptor [Candidatus Delongbacteria bacterium]
LLAVCHGCLITAGELGSISGRVVDQSTNEELIGVNIMIEGTMLGTTTDLDGRFRLDKLPPGIYQLRFNYISYQSMVVKDIHVQAGRDVPLSVSLVPSAIDINEVEVTAEALSNTEVSMIKLQKNSLTIIEGVSSELIKKNSSSDAVDVLKRMTGVNLADGKFVYIRGVGDRYNNTQLNGANLPSTDPEKKSFSYDIFSADLIEQVITTKAFTPDKPADYSGGLVEINTIEFPSKMILTFSTSAGFDSDVSLRNYTHYQGSSSDWLGYDNGTRQLPDLITDTKVVRGNYTDAELQQIGLSFKNNWATRSDKAPFNGSYKLSFGNKHDFNSMVWGYVGSLNYSNSYHHKDSDKAFYTSGTDELQYQYQSSSYTRSVLIGSLLNTSLKIGDHHKLSLKNTFNRTMDDETASFAGFYNYTSQYRDNTSLKFVSQSMSSHQLIGEHYFRVRSGLDLNWNLNYSRSERDEPDSRRYAYSRDIDNPDEPLRFLLDQSLNFRFFSQLEDENYGSALNLKLKPFQDATMPTVRIGMMSDSKSRDFSARFFGFRNIPGGNFMTEDSILQLPISDIFSAQNINSKFIEVVEQTKGADSYTSDQMIWAFYAMTDFTVHHNLTITGGLRYEHSEQNLDSKTLTNEPVRVEHDYRDLLPSLNMIYRLSSSTNLRGSYGRTLARPEFREMAPFSYYDFINNENVQGNTELVRSLIDNFDLRYEWFLSGNEMISLSLFYKYFKNPIEQTLIPTGANAPTRTFKNADHAKVYGFEIELKKNLAFLSPVMRHLSMVSNLSLIHSKIDLGDEIGFQKKDRALQGQAAYIINTGLYYDDYEKGLAVSIVYNRVGAKIAKVGSYDTGDIVEKPRDVIDISLSKRLFSRVSVKANAKDILGQNQKYIQEVPGLGDRISELVRRNPSYSIGFSYSY